MRKEVYFCLKNNIMTYKGNFFQGTHMCFLNILPYKLKNVFI